MASRHSGISNSFFHCARTSQHVVQRQSEEIPTQTFIHNIFANYSQFFLNFFGEFAKLFEPSWQDVFKTTKQLDKKFANSVYS